MGQLTGCRVPVFRIASTGDSQVERRQRWNRRASVTGQTIIVTRAANRTTAAGCQPTRAGLKPLLTGQLQMVGYPTECNTVFPETDDRLQGATGGETTHRSSAVNRTTAWGAQLRHSAGVPARATISSRMLTTTEPAAGATRCNSGGCVRQAITGARR